MSLIVSPTKNIIGKDMPCNNFINVSIAFVFVMINLMLTPFIFFFFHPPALKAFSSKKKREKRKQRQVKPEARRAISPEGCKHSAALCARSNGGVTILAAFCPFLWKMPKQAGCHFNQSNSISGLCNEA
jgi:hypothetical protein